MVQFLLDISRWQGTAPNLAQAKKEGIVGVIAKATQGASWVDPQFKFNLDRCKANGLLFAAYHYQENTSPAYQVENIKRTVPKHVPVIPDVESGSGPVSVTREIVKRLRNAGYTVPLSYIPRWYWQQIGSPSLAGLPPLWSSRYPDNNVQYYKEEYKDVPSYFWDGYGGLPVALLQFTSSAKVAGYSPLDCNAFRGTYQELHNLFTGSGGGSTPIGEDDMPLNNDDIQKIADAVWAKDLALWAAGDKAPKQMTAGQQLNQARGYSHLGFNRVGNVAALVRGLEEGTVDVVRLAEEIAPLLNATSAKALADEIHKRLAE